MVRQVITKKLTTQTNSEEGTLYTTYYPFKAETLGISDYASTKWKAKFRAILGC